MRLFMLRWLTAQITSYSLGAVGWYDFTLGWSDAIPLIRRSYPFSLFQQKASNSSECALHGIMLPFKMIARRSVMRSTRIRFPWKISLCTCLSWRINMSHTHIFHCGGITSVGLLSLVLGTSTAQSISQYRSVGASVYRPLVVIFGQVANSGSNQPHRAERWV